MKETKLGLVHDRFTFKLIITKEIIALPSMFVLIQHDLPLVVS